MDKRVRLIDIATVAGVTVASVSHALKSTGKISAATRERIRKIAEEMGYEEDPLMSALARYRKRTTQHSGWSQIAVIVPEDPHLDWRTAPDQMRLLNGIRSAATRWHLKVEIFPHDGSLKACREITRTLHNRGIKGVILSFPRPWEKERPRQLEWEKFTVMCCKPVFSRNYFNSVTTDYFSNGRILFRSLHQRGYKRIGFYFSEGLDLVSNRSFRAGVAIEQQLLTTFKDQIPHTVVSEWNYEHFNQWILNHKPDAIITQRGELRFWLKKIGLQNPKDIGIAVPSTSQGSYDSGINQNHHRMGEEAVFLVREQMALGHTGIPPLPIHLIVPASWHDGESLA